MKYSQPSKENIETGFDSFHGTWYDGTKPDHMNYFKPGKENIETQLDSFQLTWCDGTQPDEMNGPTKKAWRLKFTGFL